METGVSGSGKTSLVFDTLYQEARRRFLEVLNLGSVERPAPPRVRSITGLGPAIAVRQNLLNRNPSSTVATASGLHPIMRLLYANLGERHCARCGAAVSVLSEHGMVARFVAWAESSMRSLQGPHGLRSYARRFQMGRWVTVDLLRSLSRLDASGGWVGLEPRTPFQPYARPCRRY